MPGQWQHRSAAPAAGEALQLGQGTSIPPASLRSGWGSIGVRGWAEVGRDHPKSQPGDDAGCAP